MTVVPEMISLEDARALVLSRVELLDAEEVGILEVIGRVAAEDLKSDIDIAPFAHSAMDGFALRAALGSGAPVMMRMHWSSPIAPS